MLCSVSGLSHRPKFQQQKEKHQITLSVPAFTLQCQQTNNKNHISICVGDKPPGASIYEVPPPCTTPLAPAIIWIGTTVFGAHNVLSMLILVYISWDSLCPILIHSQILLLLICLQCNIIII